MFAIYQKIKNSRKLHQIDKQQADERSIEAKQFGHL